MCLDCLISGLDCLISGLGCLIRVGSTGAGVGVAAADSGGGAQTASERRGDNLQGYLKAKAVPYSGLDCLICSLKSGVWQVRVLALLLRTAGVPSFSHI